MVKEPRRGTRDSLPGIPVVANRHRLLATYYGIISILLSREAGQLDATERRKLRQAQLMTQRLSRPSAGWRKASERQEDYTTGPSRPPRSRRTPAAGAWPFGMRRVLLMQADGNLALYAPAKKPIRTARTGRSVASSRCRATAISLRTVSAARGCDVLRLRESRGSPGGTQRMCDTPVSLRHAGSLPAASGLDNKVPALH